jgi:putative spermidine/putrescine transport system permease protein
MTVELTLDQPEGSRFPQPVQSPEAHGASGPTLMRRLARADRHRKITALLLIAPLAGFLLFTFLLPIGGMLWRSVDDRDVARVMPRTVAAIGSWSGNGLPDEATFAALAADLTTASRDGTIGQAAKRLNYDVNGFRTLMAATVRKLPTADATDLGEAGAKEALIRIDHRWGEPNIWAAIRRASGPVTAYYLLSAIDLKRDASNHIVAAPPNIAIYREVLARTFAISLVVTLVCLVLGFPLAHLLATARPNVANLLLILVLLPFWTSLLVRTMAWIVLLQNQGVVNGLLLDLGLIDHPVRMIFNRFGVYIAMIHVLLPFMILPVYSVMQGISPAYMRAALSLGARPGVAFVRVYLPLTLPGIGAGCLLVFILALGYYITPALVGGAADQMISYFIAFYTTDTVNWGMASALGAVLLASTLLLYGVYQRLVGANGVRLG